MGRRSRSLDLVDRGVLTVLILAIGLIVIRFTGLAVGPTTVALSALPLLLPPLVAALVLSLLRRARLRVLVTLGSIALISMWWLPVFTPGPTSVLAASDGRTISSLRIMSFNTMGAAVTTREIVTAAHAENIDVLALSEMNPALSNELGKSGLGRWLRFRLKCKGVDGIEVWARMPIHIVRDLPLKHGGVQIHVTTPDPSHRTATLFIVHPASPRWFNARMWAADQARLRSYVMSSAGAAVIAGDLNMTRDHDSFRRLSADGFVDALDVTAGGWHPTWSLGANGLGLATIDHVLGRGVGFSDYRTLRIQGSDHRAVIATALIPAALG